MSSRIRKTLLIGVPAALLATMLAAAAVEAWVRLAWDDSRGTPGFFLSDPVRGQRLAANYDGWFAGVPARTNALGFRDPRDYTVAKAPRTFRILVLGDSVTFGHGAVYDTTYPYLLEQRLKAWRPDIAWEVWNLGVPGYNTAQELAYLKDLGPRVAPDLAIIGFFPNDFTGFEVPAAPGLFERATSAAVRFMQRNLYSTEFYKRVYLTMRWRWSTESADRQRLAHLETEDGLLGRANAVDAAEQRLTAVDFFTDEEVTGYSCIGEPPADPGAMAADLRGRAPHLTRWFEAVSELQHLHQTGTYRIVFFANMAPDRCAGDDRYYDHGSLPDDDALLSALGQGTPAVSTMRAFLHYRPSQMPGASSHSLGNANRVKADVLFAYLRDRVLPPLVPALIAEPR